MAANIVTNIQLIAVRKPHFIIQFAYVLGMYFTTLPGIHGNIPFGIHVLDLHFVLLQAVRGFRFIYDRQLYVVRSIHVIMSNVNLSLCFAKPAGLSSYKH